MTATIAHTSLTADAAFDLHPELKPDLFEQLTGLSRRSFYVHKKRRAAQFAGEPSEAAAQPPALNGHARPMPTAQRTTAPKKPAPAPASEAGAIAALAQPKRQKAILYGVFGAATVASTHNMYAVMAEITMDDVSAYALTGVFACTAIGFTAAGLRKRYTFWLIVALVAFEAFCNATNIYAGLYDFTAHAGTHFLCKVQSFVWFLSLQHCATTLALFAALCIAGVQYCALREINARH